MSQSTIDDTVASIQQILDRDYVHRAWRVLASHPVDTESNDESIVYVHARTCDFRYRCRIGRPWTLVAAAATLWHLAAELAAEAEQRLTEQTAATP